MTDVLNHYDERATGEHIGSSEHSEAISDCESAEGPLAPAGYDLGRRYRDDLHRRIGMRCRQFPRANC